MESLIADFLKKQIDYITEDLSASFKQAFKNKLLEYQISEYKRNYFSKTILHRSEPIELEKFYLPLKLRETTNAKTISTASVSNIFHKSRFITIIGTAGSGKSTLLKYLIINSIKNQFKIPIKIELRYLNEYSGTLYEYIVSDIIKFNQIGFTDPIIEGLLEKGKFIFLFDGYDEINSSKKEKVTKEIDKFVNRFNTNFFILTTRPYTNIELLPLFVNYYVCELHDSEIPLFVEKQIPEEQKEIIEKILKAIENVKKNSYRAFLKNPLLLSMFILTYQSYSSVPNKKSDFYNQVFDTLYHLHDSISKLSYRREKKSKLTKDQFEDVLSLFSFLSLFEEKFSFTYNYIIEKLNTIKSKKKEINFNNSYFIEDIQIAVGILHKDGLVYTFPHKSLQEYFAALYIQKLSLNNKAILYQKLLTELNTDLTKSITKDNFFSLLNEIDNQALYKYFLIPFLEQMHQELTSLFELSEKELYTYYGRFLIISILINDKNSKSFFKPFFKNAPPSYLLDDDINFNNDINLKKDLKQIKIVLNFYKTNGLGLINQFRELIADNEKSDLDIINLI